MDFNSAMKWASWPLPRTIFVKSACSSKSLIISHDQIEDKIDELIDSLSGKDYEPVSFISSKKPDIGLVQFAIHTEAIKKADNTEEETEAETETESETLLSRVKSLFS